MEQEALNQAIYAAVSPLENRIAELCQIIRVLTEQLQSVNTDGPTYVIDTETTELDPIRNELLQVSVLDLDGQVIYNSHFMPCAESWPEAEAVNHISPEMVKDAPSIFQEIATLSEILSKASTIIGYNASFDLDFLRYNGVVIAKNVEIVDVMDRFRPFTENGTKSMRDIPGRASVSALTITVTTGVGILSWLMTVLLTVGQRCSVTKQ